MVDPWGLNEWDELPFAGIEDPLSYLREALNQQNINSGDPIPSGLK